MKFPTIKFSQRARKIMLISIAVAGLAVAIGLVLYALRANINLFYTPTQVLNSEAPVERTFRVGGIVVPDSVKRDKDTLIVQFILSDTANELTVEYTGVLPDLFREGQGIVAEGMLNREKVFQATVVLAKHDEKYMPPEVRSALE